MAFHATAVVLPLQQKWEQLPGTQPLHAPTAIPRKSQVSRQQAIIANTTQLKVTPVQNVTGQDRIPLLSRVMTTGPEISISRTSHRAAASPQGHATYTATTPMTKIQRPARSGT